MLVLACISSPLRKLPIRRSIVIN